MSIPSERVKQIADKAEAKAGQKVGTGRPSIFTQEIATYICNEVASGRSLRSVCEDVSMPGQTTIFRWLSDNKDFREQYAHAREAQMDAMAEEIIDIADTENEEDVQRAKLRIDTRKWLMSKMAPKRYGDKQQMQLTGAEGEDGTPTAIQVTIVDPKR
ncbi:terminase small subunit protein [Ochrobactrum sp. SFR4]|uniref:terminase small subunit-like protein n=1 Tax=Ochrobactrum sp. SFR4 TaxID=2717368 RepID=UPI001C8C8DDE|nr:terminase small subunit protein [Ochrobactrum sp. SFR4]